MRRRTQNASSTNTSLKEVKQAVAESKKTTVTPTPNSDVKLKIKPVPVSRKRRCLNALMYGALFLLTPPFLNFASLTRERVLFNGPGKLYNIGSGQRLYLNCSGTGSPTVILDAPTGMSSDVWALIHPQLAQLTTVCVYDRAGLGFSDRPSLYQSSASEDGKTDESRNRWQPSTVERMVDDLHRLVTLSSQQPKPFLLVGSEMGGLVARFYTQIYETDVSHVVLVDPLVEDIMTQDDEIWSQFWFTHLLPSFQTMQLSAAAGITRLALLLGQMQTPISAKNIPSIVVKRQQHLLCNPRHLSSVVDEHHFINDTFSQIKTVFHMKPFPSNISVTVITGNYYDEQLPSSLNKAWAKSQQHLISQLHPGSQHIVVNGADHHMLYRKPLAVSNPIRKLILQWRKNNPQR